VTAAAYDRLIFFGTDAFSVPSLIRLLAENWNVVGVVTRPDAPAGRGRKETMPPVKRLALANGIPVLQPDRVREITDSLQDLQATAGIVVAYGQIIPKSVIDLFEKGLINVHASLLPQHRGAVPIEDAILAGDIVTGVTLMRLDPGLDTGPTFDDAKLQLAGTENRLDLYERLSELGADLLAAKLPAILEGNMVAIPQNNSHATHCKRLTKADGDIHWGKPAAQLEREIRAYLGWPGSRALIAGTPVTITEAHIVSHHGPAGTAYRTPAGELAVYSTEGSLVIDRLTPAGKREMTGPAFLAGHPL
jgi:methionyl-tRNA formyltransferase